MGPGDAVCCRRLGAVAAVAGADAGAALRGMRACYARSFRAGDRRRLGAFIVGYDTGQDVLASQRGARAAFLRRDGPEWAHTPLTPA